MFDTVATELPKVNDRRLALECQILKDLRNVKWKWLPSQQMVADVLTNVGSPLRARLRKLMLDGKYYRKYSVLRRGTFVDAVKGLPPPKSQPNGA